MTQSNTQILHNSASSSSNESAAMPGLTTEFLTPEQRLDLIADILATMTLQAMRKHHENKSTDS